MHWGFYWTWTLVTFWDFINFFWVICQESASFIIMYSYFSFSFSYSYLLLLQVLLVSCIRGEMMDWLVNSGDFDSIPQTSATARSRTSDPAVYFRPYDRQCVTNFKVDCVLPISFVFAGVFLHMVIGKYFFICACFVLFGEIITVLPMLILFQIVVFVNVNWGPICFPITLSMTTLHLFHDF